jgi:hypothetical protein
MTVDGNHNGVIDQADYAVWRAHFGQTAGGSGSFNHVALPEPAIRVMLLTGLMAMFVRRHVIVL